MGTNAYNRLAKIALALGLIFLVYSVATPQTIKGHFRIKLTIEEVEDLLNKLKYEMNLVPEKFFGDVYDEQVPDIVFFIEKKKIAKQDKNKNSPINEYEPTKIMLLKGNKKLENLSGEPYIYVMVFVAGSEPDKQNVKEAKCKSSPPERITIEKTYKENIVKTEKESKVIKESMIKTETGIKDAKKESLKLSVKHTFLEQRLASGEFVLFSIAKGIAKALGSFAPETKKPGEKPKKDQYDLEMVEIGRFQKTCLSFGQVRIPLPENTMNRITIHGFKEIVSSATFGNYSKSRLTSSIGLLWTYLDSKTAEDQKTYQLLVEPFLFANIYLKKPKLPPPRFPRHSDQRKPQSTSSQLSKKQTHKSSGVSYSLILGTKIEKDVFDDIFIGASIGHFIPDIPTGGIIIGVNFRSIPIQENDKVVGKKNKRHASFSIGFTFIF